MPVGGGKYEKEAARVCRRLRAAGLILIVIEGERGSGFDVIVTPEVAPALPDALEKVVAQMRAEWVRLGLITEDQHGMARPGKDD